MQDFTFQNQTKIIFGQDTEKKIGMETKEYASEILLHYGGGSIKKYGTYQKVVASLKEGGHYCP